jgi:hypothetical protein
VIILNSIASKFAALVRSYVYSDLVPTFIQAQVGNALGLASDFRQHGASRQN